jgi:hypothetical protein
MADISKAQQRQKGKASNKAQYSGNFMRGIKNKIRRMARTLRQHPNNHDLAARLDWWRKEGARTRKGTKYGA